MKNGTKTIARGSDGLFLKGNKGGPGRPRGLGKVRRFQQALSKLDPDQLDDIDATILEKFIDAARRGEAWALKEYLDRKYGKALQPIDVTGDLPMATIQIIIEKPDG